MMERRAFVAGMTAAFAAPLGTAAYQTPKVPRIGFLATVPLSAMADRIEAFRQGLRDLGYVDGENVRIDFRSADGHYERLSVLASDLVGQRVDVIVTAGQPAPDAVRKVTRTIPIVVPLLGDPVADGLVASLDRPGGTLTGLSSIAPDLVGKQLQLLKEIVPKVSRVAVLREPAHRGHSNDVRAAQVASTVLGVRLVVVDVASAADLDGAFRRMASERVDGALVLRAGFFVHLRDRLAQSALKARLPTMFGHAEEAQAGGLMAYGTDVPALYRRAATYVDKILRGASPAELPVEQPAKFSLVINLKTARALGLTIPPSLLLRADQVIE